MQNSFAPHAWLRARFVLGAFALFVATLVHAVAPVISGTPPTTATVGQLYSFQPTATDGDNQKLTFWVVNKPSWATFSTTTGKLSGTPTATGTFYGITIWVTDNGHDRNLPTFSITVKAAGTTSGTNQPPTISGSPATTAKVGTAYSFTPTARDPEGAKLTFGILNKPSWMAFDATTGKLSGTPTSSNVGTYNSIQIGVSDGKLTATLPTFSLAVSTTTTTTNSAPVISGSPGTSVVVGTSYSFTPTASDANKDPLTFSITNKPAWASFSTSTGQLSGTPSSSYGGTTTSNIVIAVSDGKVKTSMAPFSITVAQSGTTGTAALSWTPPTTNTNGSTLTNLAGYRINYGTSSSALNKTVQIPTPGVTSYVVTNLTTGTWYFAIQAYSSSGTTSNLSNVASKAVK